MRSTGQISISDFGLVPYEYTGGTLFEPGVFRIVDAANQPRLGGRGRCLTALYIALAWHSKREIVPDGALVRAFLILEGANHRDRAHDPVQ